MAGVGDNSKGEGIPPPEEWNWDRSKTVLDWMIWAAVFVGVPVLITAAVAIEIEAQKEGISAAELLERLIKKGDSIPVD